jgi:hypothetical protein
MSLAVWEVTAGNGWWLHEYQCPRAKALGIAVEFAYGVHWLQPYHPRLDARWSSTFPGVLGHIFLAIALVCEN